MPKVLTKAEVRAFREHGYHGPVRAMSAEQARHYRACFERFEERWPDDRQKLDQGASLLCPWYPSLSPGLKPGGVALLVGLLVPSSHPETDASRSFYSPYTSTAPGGTCRSSR